LIFDKDSVRGIVVNGKDQFFDAVVSTVPLPAFLRLIPPSLQGEYWTRLRNIESIGVLCVFLRTAKRLSKFFWTNINDPRIELAGLIEYTNLNPLSHLGGDSIVYLPQYIPSTAEKFSKSNEAIIHEYLGYLKVISPHFSEDQVKQAFVFREKYAQPICDVGFTKDIPEMRTPLRGLYLTDSSQLHPDDRTISNSLGLGKSAAAFILADEKLLSPKSAPALRSL
jgi:protoporphyrinogen oxidase